MTWADIAGAFSNLGDVMNSAMGIITGNAGLLTLFAGSVVVVGFKIFKRARKAVR